MTSIQAGTDPTTKFPNSKFWIWEGINIVVPLIGILFLDWHIFTLIILFWWEIACWGIVGLLKILSANGAPSLLGKLTSRIGGCTFFVVLYGGLSLILFSYSFIEFETESTMKTERSLLPAMLIVGVNYLVDYFRSEIATWRFLFRHPYEVIMERLLYAIPLCCLILFAVIPLSHKFDGSSAEKIIGVGVILSKFLMDTAIRFLPGIVLTFNQPLNEGSGD